MSSFDALFRPSSVAVVGASRDRSSIGYSIVHNLVRGEFTGAIYPVNPKAKAIHSLRCYPSLAAIPDPIDLAVVTVPRPRCRKSSRRRSPTASVAWSSSPPATARPVPRAVRSRSRSATRSVPPGSA
ncbi:MAG: CoA-binding protein [Thermoanaerobaculia bacterium]